jgi:hypothetical protein
VIDCQPPERLRALRWFSSAQEGCALTVCGRPHASEVPVRWRLTGTQINDFHGCQTTGIVVVTQETNASRDSANGSAAFEGIARVADRDEYAGIHGRSNPAITALQRPDDPQENSYTSICPARALLRSRIPINPQPRTHSTRVRPAGASMASSKSPVRSCARPATQPILINPKRRRRRKQFAS